MDRGQQHEDRNFYDERFLNLSDSVERLLLRLAIALFLLLVVFQGLLNIDGLRERLTVVDRLEGERVGFAHFLERMIY